MCKRKRRYTSRIYVYIKVNSRIEKMWRAHTHNTTAAKKKFKRNGITILQFKSKPLNGAACIMCVQCYEPFFGWWRGAERGITIFKNKTKLQCDFVCGIFFLFGLIFKFIWKTDTGKVLPIGNWTCATLILRWVCFFFSYARLLTETDFHPHFRYLNSFKSHYEYYDHWIYANAINWCASVSVRAFIMCLINANRLVIE